MTGASWFLVALARHAREHGGGGCARGSRGNAATATCRRADQAGKAYGAGKTSVDFDICSAVCGRLSLDGSSRRWGAAWRPASLRVRRPGSRQQRRRRA